MDDHRLRYSGGGVMPAEEPPGGDNNITATIEGEPLRADTAATTAMNGNIKTEECGGGEGGEEAAAKAKPSPAAQPMRVLFSSFNSMHRDDDDKLSSDDSDIAADEQEDEEESMVGFIAEDIVKEEIEDDDHGHDVGLLTELEPHQMTLEAEDEEYGDGEGGGGGGLSIQLGDVRSEAFSDGILMARCSPQHSGGDVHNILNGSLLGEEVPSFVVDPSPRGDHRLQQPQGGGGYQAHQATTVINTDSIKMEAAEVEDEEHQEDKRKIFLNYGDTADAGEYDRNNQHLSVAAADADEDTDYDPSADYEQMALDNHYDVVEEETDGLGADVDGDEFRCATCSKRYTTQSLLERHTAAGVCGGSRRRDYGCCYCSREFSNRRSFWKHLRFTHKKTVDQCKLVMRSDETGGGQRSASSQCPLCIEQFIYKKSLRKHVLNEHMNELDSLPSSFPLPPGVRRKKKKRKLRPEPELSERKKPRPPSEEEEQSDWGQPQQPNKGDFRCAVCGKSFITRKPFMKHMAGHERLEAIKEQEPLAVGSRRSETAKMSANNSRQDDESFRTVLQSTPRRNSNGVDPPERFSCNTCGMTFISLVVFKEHVRREHVQNAAATAAPSAAAANGSSQKPAANGSAVMGTAVTTSIVHTQDGRTLFKCDGCDKNFNFRMSLQKHMERNHQGEKQPKASPAQDLVPELSSEASDPAATSSCDVCNKTFGTRRLLEKHSLGVHGKDISKSEAIGLMECPFCFKKYKASRRALEKHIRALHSEQINGNSFNINSISKNIISKNSISKNSISISKISISCNSSVNNSNRSVNNINSSVNNSSKSGLGSNFNSLAHHREEKSVVAVKPPVKPPPANADIFTTILKSDNTVTHTTRGGAPMRRLRCGICDSCFDQNVQLERHLRDNHRCDICFRMFASKPALEKHMSANHVVNLDGKYVCRVCHVAHSFRSQVLKCQESHSAASPSKLSKSPSPGGPDTSKPADKPVDKSAQSCVLPALEHYPGLSITPASASRGPKEASNNPFSFTSITVASANSTTRTSKAEAHHQQQPKPTSGAIPTHLLTAMREAMVTSPTAKKFKCLRCSKSFNYLNSLSQHEKEHFSCTNCQKSRFSTPKALTEHHYECHTLAEGHRCNRCEICNLCFSTHSDLMTHTQRGSHANVEASVKKYVKKCPHCRLPFETARGLELHEKVHHPETTFVCEICFIGKFLSPYSLDLHKAVEHGTGGADPALQHLVRVEYHGAKPVTALRRANGGKQSQKVLVCKVCTSGFTHMKAFTDHRKSFYHTFMLRSIDSELTQSTMKSKRWRYYTCPDCKLSFLTLFMLKSHSFLWHSPDFDVASIEARFRERAAADEEDCGGTSEQIEVDNADTDCPQLPDDGGWPAADEERLDGGEWWESGGATDCGDHLA